MHECYLDREIFRKQNFAKANAKCVDCEVLDEVLTQIEFCEELGKGLSETQILEMLKLKNPTQVENFCHDIKMAS